MKFVVVASLLVAGAVATPNYQELFQSFKTTHGRTYASADEESRKFRTFSENMQRAAELTRRNPQASFGPNAFADLTAAEFKAYHNADRHYKAALAKPSKSNKAPTQAEIRAAAGQSVDWRKKGAVTPVKNQGQCGSCWSFSTTGGIEGQWFLAGNTLTSLSEQELVSCDTIDSGCNGGLMDNAFDWLVQNRKGELVTETSYPYVSGGGNVPACSASLGSKPVGATITGHHDITKNEDAMATFVYSSGPLSIAVDASVWQTYTGGIVSDCPAGQLDHGVLIVGFSDEAPTPYWIVKNSWAATWGEQGYIRLQKGTNQCNIKAYPTTSLVKKGSPTPAPAGGFFYEKTCTDDKCKHCRTHKVRQGHCLAGRGDDSYEATCSSQGLVVNQYSAKNCSGSFTTVTEPVDQCVMILKDHKAEFKTVSCGHAPTPAPTITTAAPSSGSLTQMHCANAACNIGCQNVTFALNKCIPLNGGGSATATCQATTVTLTVFGDSSCSGSGQPDVMALDQCLADAQGSHFENVCNSAAVSSAQAGLRRLGH